MKEIIEILFFHDKNRKIKCDYISIEVGKSNKLYCRITNYSKYSIRNLMFDDEDILQKPKKIDIKPKEKDKPFYIIFEPDVNRFKPVNKMISFDKMI